MSPPSSSHLPGAESLCTSVMDGQCGCTVRAGVREVSPMYHGQGEAGEGHFVCVPFLILCQDMAGSLWDFHSTYSVSLDSSVPETV